MALDLKVFPLILVALALLSVAVEHGSVLRSDLVSVDATTTKIVLLMISEGEVVLSQLSLRRLELLHAARPGMRVLLLCLILVVTLDRVSIASHPDILLALFNHGLKALLVDLVCIWRLMARHVCTVTALELANLLRAESRVILEVDR